MTTFALATHLTNVRLLELPQELLDLLTSPNCPKLHLRSATPSAPAVLTTDKRTYPLRQIQTSNTLFLLQPTSPTTYTPGKPLRTPAGSPTSLHDLESRAPLSIRDLHDAWTALCAYVKDGYAVRPSAAALLALWRRIKSAAEGAGWNLEEGFSEDDLFNEFDLDASDAIESEMFDAVMKRIGECHYKEGWWMIPRPKATTWVAQLVLEASGGSMPTDLFVARWREAMGGWGDGLAAASIGDITTHPTPTTIALKPECRLSPAPAAKEEPATTGKRKWHEKFGKGRK
ncbi:hypothetical protein EJ06DRAFT_524543 [Trichodelitschia bisporula]|uniref:Uncharacterized protein n=1 Tax=Trichodelitschia bisporula TaxID=703511 RepID=A0A6G1HKQ2_9PEZI|nr:hypothetical protein EJ06DRAFT_524543 [Trichodelitschia bisporula]